MDAQFCDLLDAADKALEAAVAAVAKARDYAHKQSSNTELSAGSRAMAALARNALTHVEGEARAAWCRVTA